MLGTMIASASCPKTEIHEKGGDDWEAGSAGRKVL